MEKVIVDLALEKGLEDYIIHVWKEYEPGYIKSVKNYEWSAVLSVMQKWLREEHDIDVLVNQYIYKGGNYFVHIITKEKDFDLDPGYTYEEVLEGGLEEALKLIED